MIRTVSLWIRINGKFSRPLYQDNKQTRLKLQDGEYYLRCAGKWYPVGNDPLLALDAKAAKEKLLRAVERGTVPESEALPHLNPPSEETRLTVESAINTYMTTGKAAQKDWRKHTRQCYTLALKLFTESCKKTYMDEIDGDDLRVFKVFLRKQRTSIGKYIDPRTVYNHFLNTVSFLNTHKLRDLIPQNEALAYDAHSAAGRHEKKTAGPATVGMNGTRSTQAGCARRAFTNGLQPSASSVAAGRRTRIGTRNELLIPRSGA